MGWNDIHTKEILYDPNGTEVVRREGVYGGPLGLAILVRNSLLAEANLMDANISKYSIKYRSYAENKDWEVIESQEGRILDAHAYFKVGDRVMAHIWIREWYGIVQSIQGFTITVLTDDGETKTEDYTFMTKGKRA